MLLDEIVEEQLAEVYVLWECDDVDDLRGYDKEGKCECGEIERSRNAEEEAVYIKQILLKEHLQLL